MRPLIEILEYQIRRLEPMGLSNPSKTPWLTGPGPGLARQDEAGRGFEWVWNENEPF
jgi:hypothetical protein